MFGNNNNRFVLFDLVYRPPHTVLTLWKALNRNMGKFNGFVRHYIHMFYVAPLSSDFAPTLTQMDIPQMTSYFSGKEKTKLWRELTS